MFDAKLEPKEMNALKVDGTVDVSKKNYRKCPFKSSK